MMKSLPTLAIALASGVLLAEKPPFSHYQPIIDRQPFGPPPPGFNPDSSASEAQAAQTAAAKAGKELTKEQETLQKSVAFNAINVEAGGAVMVGFTDKSDARRPKCHYVGVGQVEDGWTVKAADPVAKSAVIEKDGVELTLSLGAESSAAASGAAQPQSAAPQRSGLLGERGGASAPAAGLSLRSRRAARAAAEKAAAEKAAEDRAKAAEEAARQREAAKQELAEMKEQIAAEREKAAAEREKEKEEQRRALAALQAEQQKLQQESGGDKDDEEDDDAQD